MNQAESYSILVVDDEPDLCEILRFNLEMEGYAADVAQSAEEALEMIPAGGYDLLLLDVMMSGMSGFALARQLKNDVATRELPVIFLTARDTENDVITGLNLGADDYIHKPFSLRELLARVRAVLRRTTARAATSSVIAAEGLAVDDARKLVTIDGTDAQFTRTEFDLLRLLLSERGRVFSRQELLAQVWPQDVVVTLRSVDVCVTRLRKKLGRYAARLITKPGFGYAYEEND